MRYDVPPIPNASLMRATGSRPGSVSGERAFKRRQRDERTRERKRDALVLVVEQADVIGERRVLRRVVRLFLEVEDVETKALGLANDLQLAADDQDPPLRRSVRGAMQRGSP